MSLLLNNKKTNFTFVELMVVVAVLAILMSMIFPSFQRFRTLAEQNVCKSNMKHMAAAFSVYQEDHEGFFPYGVNTTALTNNQISTDSLSPQELIYDYLSTHKEVYTCPSDLSPENYVWWRYRGHPNGVTSSSYMFCENGLYGNVFSWRGGQPLSNRTLANPSTYVYMSDGNFAPNGWGWWSLDPAKYDPNRFWRVRIDWDHEQYVNLLHGDMSVASKWRYDDISYMRNRADVDTAVMGIPY